MTEVQISSNLPPEPHTPHTPQKKKELRRKPARNRSSSLMFNLLAKSKNGDHVLVQQKNGLPKVLSSEQCSKDQMLVLESRPNFSPPDHKRQLRHAKYHEISQCVVIPYGKTKKKLIVYNLECWGIQWLTEVSVDKVLETKKTPDVKKFRQLFEKLQAGVDSGDTVAAVSGTDKSGPGSNESEFNTLLKKHAEIVQQLIDLATENPAKVQGDIMEMLKSDAKLTFGAVYPDMGLLQEILCRATKSDNAVGEILSNIPFSMLLAYLKSVNPEDRAKAVDTWSTDNTKNMQWLLRVIVSLENSMEELVKTNNQEDGVITIGFRPLSNDHVETC
jgi:hypothetical protein